MPIKRLSTLLFLKAVTLNAASDSWYFRGTANYWKTTAMKPLGDQWVITVDFAKEEVTAGFRIDHYGDWQEAYPKQEFPVRDCSRYTIRFQPNGRIIQATRLGAVTTGACATSFIGKRTRSV